jgi:2-keto-3-deoxy-L-rhamnonate aldolase RhmA
MSARACVTAGAVLLSVAAAAPARAQTPTPLAAKPPLKERLKRGEACTGAFIGLLAGAPTAMYLAGQGLDYFILDIEHYTFDPIVVREMITAARLAGIAPILRVGAATQDITRWLDAGAEGIVVPDVETPEQAQALVKFGRYPPLGDRGASSMNAHTTFVRQRDLGAFNSERNRNILLLVMIETPKGFDKLDRILSVAGIDGAIMGTGDYSNAIGVPGQMDHPRTWQAAERLVKYCQTHSKLVSVPIRSAANVAHWQGLGVNMLSFVDTALLGDGIQANLAQVKRTTTGGSK